MHNSACFSFFSFFNHSHFFTHCSSVSACFQNTLNAATQIIPLSGKFLNTKRLIEKMRNKKLIQQQSNRNLSSSLQSNPASLYPFTLVPEYIWSQLPPAAQVSMNFSQGMWLTSEGQPCTYSPMFL